MTPDVIGKLYDHKLRALPKSCNQKRGARLGLPFLMWHRLNKIVGSIVLAANECYRKGDEQFAEVAYESTIYRRNGND